MRKSVQSTKQKRSLTLIAGAMLFTFLTSCGTGQKAFSAQETGASGNAPSQTQAPASESMVFRTETKEERKKALNMNQLHRLDFRVTGSSCAACLGRIRKRIDKVKGVYEVAVAIKPPYGVAVIYDSTKTNMDKLLDAAKKDEKLEIEFHDMKDGKIESPPLILVPVYSSLKRD